jgi:hypothetical protein
MTTDSTAPAQPLSTKGNDAATGTDKAMKQFSRTDSERERAAEGTTAPDADENGVEGDRKIVDSTQPPPSTAPA